MSRIVPLKRRDGARCNELIRHIKTAVRDVEPGGRCTNRGLYAVDGVPMCRVHANSRAFEILQGEKSKSVKPAREKPNGLGPLPHP